MNSLIITVPLGVFLLDRIAKWWAVTFLCQAPLSVWGEYISCMLTYNRGVSWSLFTYHDALGFSIITLCIIIVIGLLITHMIRQYQKNVFFFGELLVLGGAVSNLYDRLVYGGVVDFIALRYGSWQFPIFNIADIAIVCGAILMLYDATITR